MRKLTNYEFIERSIYKHDNKYSYENTNYNGMKKKVSIICRIHGEFNQTAGDHIGGCGCQKCDITTKLTTIDFISKSIDIHGDTYDYTKSNYGNNNYQKVIITCHIHGDFKQTPLAHMRGQGCPDCKSNKLKTTEEFIEQSIKIHNNTYDYSLTEYKSNKSYIKIICKRHGEFEQKAYIHLQGHGCRKCKSSKLENYMMNILDENNIPYKVDMRFNDCRNIRPLPFDFWLPNHRICIECDGIQHRQPIDHFGGLERFEYQKQNDLIKNEWCRKNGITIIRISSI